ncbi:MAG: dynamin family protein [Kineosporiaceae bacterium]
MVGEFKKGKSSLVNALVGAQVCPVDDDIATALPTYIRHGEQAAAHLLHPGADGGEARRQPVPLSEIRRHITDRRDDDGPAPPGQPSGVEVLLPRSMLASGLVLVDTPGLGGLGSRHAAASLAATSLADAVVFVTDASQEITAAEHDFLKRARDMCDTVLCVVTKRDFYPEWRRIIDLDRGHLAGLGDIDVMAVSSSLRTQAVAANDRDLSEESGFPPLVRFVTGRVAGGAVEAVVRDVAAEVEDVCVQLARKFEGERAALADPRAARAVVDGLRDAKDRAERLKDAAARWSTTLGDGIADLTADIDHDLRARIRRVLAEADDTVEAGDPADTWAQMEPWLESRISAELVENYALLRDRAVELSALVAEHFREAAGEILQSVAVHDPTPRLASADAAEVATAGLTLEKMSARKQAMVALKGSYSGILMFTLLGGMLGLSLTVLAIPIGLMMGRSGLREEKKRQLAQRQAQAKNAVRKYCDEVSFVMSKDSRDTLRRIQRQLRDHYSDRATELQRSTAQALTAANEAAKATESERTSRLRDLDAELKRLAALRERAVACRTSASPGSPGTAGPGS